MTDDASADPGCWFHGDEPTTDAHVLVCGECGHAFTAEELLRRDYVARVDAHRDAIARELSYLLGRVRSVDATVPEGWSHAVELTLEASLDDLRRTRDVDDVTVCPLCAHDL